MGCIKQICAKSSYFHQPLHVFTQRRSKAVLYVASIFTDYYARRAKSLFRLHKLTVNNPIACISQIYLMYPNNKMLRFYRSSVVKYMPQYMRLMTKKAIDFLTIHLFCINAFFLSTKSMICCHSLRSPWKNRSNEAMQEMIYIEAGDV